MGNAKTGDRVKVCYKGYLRNGRVFDESRRDKPLEFVIGKRVVPAGLESAVMGMEEKQTKMVSIPPEEAFGKRRDNLIASIKRDELPQHIDPQVGKRLKIQSSNGKFITVRVTDVGEDTVTLDANHQLAGETLKYEITLLEVV
jgi:FKBP-type peptidyl-prolyl cis-trans isomerase 2